jgi:hypothetical protein
MRAIRCVSERGRKNIVSGSLHLMCVLAAVMAAEAAAAAVAQSGYSMTCQIFNSHRQHQARAVLPLRSSRWEISLLSLKLTTDVVAIINSNSILLFSGLMQQ